MVKGYVVRWSDGQTSALPLVAAVDLWAEQHSMEPVSAPRIFAVAEDGTETPLPTYEEALAVIAQPVAADALVTAEQLAKIEREAQGVQGSGWTLPATAWAALASMGPILLPRFAAEVRRLMALQAPTRARGE